MMPYVNCGKEDFAEQKPNNLGNEFPVGVVGVLQQLGRRKDPFSLPPPQCLWALLSCLSTEHLKPNSRHVLEFALMATVVSSTVCSIVQYVHSMCTLETK